jgi:tryptophan-rich sensory protein
MSALALAGFLVAVLAAAATGSLFRPGGWYARLAKPAWTPPNALFPVAWTLLYLAMAVAAWRVALRPSPLAGAALAFWSCQLVLNALWSPVVFGLRHLGAGVVVITGLFAALLVTLALFARVDALAGWLLVPYALWIAYAAALNLAVWRLNPEVRRDGGDIGGEIL